MGFLELLVSEGRLKRNDLPEIMAEIKEKGDDEAVLFEHGVRPEETLAAKSQYYKIPSKVIDSQSMSFDVFKLIPEESARHYAFVPLAIEDGVLSVGCTDPDNLEARDALQFIAGKLGLPYKLFLISKTDFNKVFQMYQGLSGNVTKALGDFQSSQSAEEAELQKKRKQKVEVGKTTIVEDAPVSKIIATILEYAIDGDASDVHIEPGAEKVRVRFRVDGVLHTSLLLPMSVHNALISRVKILSNLRLDEKRKPQDGRFSEKFEGRSVDFRVSTFPTYYGEKMEMRILDPGHGIHSLDQIGFSPETLRLLRDAIKRPYGMILISGPTGSGKSTTLYALLQEIDREGHNVVSLEDPIEYNIDGVNQSQIFPEIDYTFANGLRTTLRQDPDIIMVGEIRDKETAGLAIQAALTGHLVFSTIHTNNAFGVIPRLIDMEVDPYLIAPTLVLAVAQRLVKKLCPDSGKPIPVDGSIEAMLTKQFGDLPDEFRKKIIIPKQVFSAEATPICPSGTRGRTAVAEVLPMDRELEDIILKKPNELEILKASRRKGLLTMREDAILKAFAKIIPFEEVNTLGE